MLSRRNFFSAGAISLAMARAPRAWAATRPRLTVYRDPNCGCCGKWIDLARASGRFEVAVVQSGDVAAVKKRLAVPDDLWSCHTTVVSGYVVEGHVPLDAIERLLRQRPSGMAGLAVAGMPAGAPGMEVPGREDAFDVVAFGKGGRRLFQRHG
jgi:hypothetical protein